MVTVITTRAAGWMARTSIKIGMDEVDYVEEKTGTVKQVTGQY